MEAPDTSFSSDNKMPKILLVGDVTKAFLDAADVPNICQVCANLADGVAAATKDDFAVIGLVMSGTSGALGSALKALREATRDARIILLAQMWQEPAALELVRRTPGELVGAALPKSRWQAVADDYLICPIRFSQFQSHILRSFSSEGAVLQDEAVEQRGGALKTAAIDSKSKKRIELLEKLATEDDLTELQNRRYIWEFSRQIIEHARSENGRVTLLVFDIDDLKRYNDLYGHRAGDEILRQAAILMRRCCRHHDVIGRIGGDEFAVVFWDDPSRQTGGTEAERRSAMADHPKEVVSIARRFVKELEKAELHLLGPAGKGVLTISGGLASFPRDGSTIQELFQRADEALLEAKRSGKNRIYLVGKPQSDITDLQ
jgi:diguanylate cyclase (GGDEF)-like protein